jgi:uncharacterized protein related to proFAR isomerase
MSKELEVLNIYIQQQQQKINEMTQTILMLHTKNAVLEKQVASLQSINSEQEIKSNTIVSKETIKRKSISKQIDASHTINLPDEKLSVVEKNESKESFLQKINKRWFKWHQ